MKRVQNQLLECLEHLVICRLNNNKTSINTGKIFQWLTGLLAILSMRLVKGLVKVWT